MDDCGGLGPLGIGNWNFYEAQWKKNLSLQLSSQVIDRETKPIHSNSLCYPNDFGRDGWMNNRGSSSSSNATKFLHSYPQNPTYTLNDAAIRTLQMPQHPILQPKSDIALITYEPEERKEVPLKKRSEGPSHKLPKPKKPKKCAAPKNENSQRKSVKRSGELVINGIDLDISEIPTPVCSCTGRPRQCYRWGVGGWQSACCTKGISMYPLPANMKRRGARIAGRKMSLGAFKKVLEKLAGEGQNLSNPIDLKPYWAKHGTNKFVTIR